MYDNNLLYIHINFFFKKNNLKRGLHVELQNIQDSRFSVIAQFILVLKSDDLSTRVAT